MINWFCNRVKSTSFDLHTLLHHQLSINLHEISHFKFLIDNLQKVQRANGTLDSSFQTSLNAGRVKEVKTEERSNLVPLLYLVIAYRTLPGLAVIGRFQEMG